MVIWQQVQNHLKWMYLVSHELLVADENHVVDVDMDHLMSHLLVQEILVDLVA